MKNNEISQNVIVKIEAVGSRTKAVSSDGTDYSNEMPSYKRKQILGDTGRYWSIHVYYTQIRALETKA